MTRTRVCFYIILFMPLVVYWQAVFGDYGLRDDYSHIRETREEPGKVVKFTASHGRPLYGALLESSVSHVSEVNSLQWLRLGTVGLLTLLALALWQQLYRGGWNEIEAAAIGLGVVFLPAAQIVSSWAICWPHVLALLMAVGGFTAVEAELERGGLKRAVALLGGALIYMAASLIYQSNAMFAVVLIAAMLLVRTGREPWVHLRWLLTHLGILGAGLLAGFLLIKFFFASGVFEASPRMRFEDDLIGKVGWFLTHALPNALGLFALRDDYNQGAVAFWATGALIVAVIGLAYRMLPQESRWRWLVSVAVLPFAAHVVSLAADERSIGYRVLFALSGLVLVLVVFTIRVLREVKWLRLNQSYAVLAAVVLVGALTAHMNSLHLVAEPQAREWSIIHKAVQRHAFKDESKIFIVTPTPDDRSTVRMFADEFGSLSSDSDWAPREMFKAAVYERFNGILPKGASYQVVLGRAEPPAGSYDLVVDMRKLRAMGER